MIFDNLLRQLLLRADKRSFPREDVEKLVKQCNPYLEHAYFFQEGGESLVFIAIDKYLNRSVIVKIISPALEEKEKKRIIRSLAIQQKLHCLCTKGIVPEIFSYSIEQNFHIVMEFVNGIDFYSYVQKLTKASRIHAVISFAEFLQEIHNRLVVHSDIKPENILVLADGKTALIDWSMSVQLDKKQNRLTREMERMGTPGYVGPEQLDGIHAEDRNFASDIFSVGILFYVACTLKLPELDSGIPPSPVLDFSLLSLAEMKIIQQATQRKQEDRYESIAEMIAVIKTLHGKNLEEESSEPAPIATISPKMTQPIEAQLIFDSGKEIPTNAFPRQEPEIEPKKLELSDKQRIFVNAVKEAIEIIKLEENT